MTEAEESKTDGPAGGAKPSWAPMVWGSLVLLGVAAALLAVAAMLVASQSGKRQGSCKNNLRQVLIACHLYADEYDNRFPPGFQEIYPLYMDNARIFSCPTRPSTWEDFKAGRVTASSSSYGYVPGLSPSMPGSFVLAFDRSRENHAGKGLHVVFIDGPPEWWPASREAEFERRLALQNEAFEKWRASGKPVYDIGEFVSPELREMMAPSRR